MIVLAFNRFLAYFQHPSLTGIGIALIMAVVWGLLYGLPVFKDKRLWLMLLGGLVCGLLAASFIQTIINQLLGWLMNAIWRGDTVRFGILLVGVLSVLVAGLVQEGARILPLIFLRKQAAQPLDARFGLLAGAAAGIGVGFLEAQWVQNAVFAAGWKLNMLLDSNALPVLLSFWERLAMMGVYAGLSAMIGYGLSKGKGWQYYLLAALLHALAKLGLYLMTYGLVSMVLVEVLLTVMAVVLTVVMLSLRWEK